MPDPSDPIPPAPPKTPRHQPGVIDQRQQQTDPAGRQRVDPNEAAKRSQKQPGQDPRNPQDGPADAE